MPFSSLRSLLLGFALSACGTKIDDTFVMPDADRDTTDTTDAELAPFADASAQDTYVAPIDLADAAGLFLCNGCVCDGTKNYCDDSWSPGPILVDASSFGDAGYCADSSFNARCTPLPAPCRAHLTCECLSMYASPTGGCPCSVDDSGAGLVYTCMYADRSHP